MFKRGGLKQICTVVKMLLLSPFKSNLRINVMALLCFP